MMVQRSFAKRSLPLVIFGHLSNLRLYLEEAGYKLEGQQGVDTQSCTMSPAIMSCPASIQTCCRLSDLSLIIPAHGCSYLPPPSSAPASPD